MNKIFADEYYKMLTYAASRLNAEAEKVNALNVFPVPDGDTGSNMSMTISGVNNMSGESRADLGKCSKAAADLMLRSARGNSGVILSVFFRGFASRLAGLESAGTEELIAAFAAGTEAAYGSVMNPTEGTILSVMRAAAEAVAPLDGVGLDEFFNAAKLAGEKALAHTPEQLPVLKEAGVVDAGGCGFMIILTAMNAVLCDAPEAVGFTVPEPAVSPVSAAAACGTEIKYPYCTECIVEKSAGYAGENKTNELHKYILSAGDSAVYVEDESIVKLHVHTSDPGSVLSEAEKYGTLLTVKVENMRKQHTELQTGGSEPLSDGVGIVAVTNGDGLRNIFIDLGVDEVVSGGQTMNPSTEELLAAIRRVGKRSVLILPNNSNIILASESAAKLAAGLGIDARVIPSKTVPQGITALYSFVPEADVKTNIDAMNAALPTVKTVTATYAVRDAVVNGLKIKRGQFIGLVENNVRRVADSLSDCVDQLIGELNGMSCITAYCGSDLTPEQEKEISERITEKIGDRADVTVVSGGQPVYTIILSGE